jgi:hypothetical protein
MFCAQCGHQVDQVGRFCAHCGKALIFPTSGTAQPPPQTQDQGPAATSIFHHARAGLAVEPTTPPTPKANYFVRHWRGELSLPVSYWVNTFLLGMVLAMLITVAGPLGDRTVTNHFRAVALGTLGFFALVLAISLWQVAGTIRSALRYMAEGHSTVWGSLAILGMVIGGLNLVVVGMDTMWPATKLYSQLLVGKDPMGTYALRLLNDSSELEVRGMLTFGVSEEVRKMLEAHPQVRVMHLNSDGGRVAEARGLRDLISAHSLATYSATGCSSACTIAYMAGKDRLLAQEASLGFHQYSFPGSTQADFQADYQKDRRDWAARGVDGGFAAKAFETPSARMWQPTRAELVAARVITQDRMTMDLAVSGVSAARMNDDAAFERDLIAIPLYAAIRESDPKAYEQIAAKLKDGVRRGHTMVNIRAETQPIVKEVLTQKLPHASTEAMQKYVMLIIDQYEVLYKVDPALCFDYAMQGNADSVNRATRHFSKEMGERELAVMADVIRSAKQPRAQPPEKTALAAMRKVAARLREVHGDKADLLGEDVLVNDKALGCRLTHDFFAATTHLDRDEADAAWRFLFSKNAT